MTRPFPLPGLLVQGAYRELQIAQYGSDEERAALGRIEKLDRPWQPFTCKPAVRQQLWQWLDEVVVWVNHEYGWVSTGSSRPAGPRTRTSPTSWPSWPTSAAPQGWS